MDKHWEDFETGEIHVRDKWQFELKSEFIPASGFHESVFTQEFYIFIPNSLQINDQTYSKARFYEDQTNLIRYKTPELSFAQLVNLNNRTSTLARLQELSNQQPCPENKQILERELKLFANIFRSTLRDDVHLIVETLKRSGTEAYNTSYETIKMLLEQVEQTIALYGKEEEQLSKKWTDLEDVKLFGYVRDFLSISLNYSLSFLLDGIRSLHDKNFQALDDSICSILIEERRYRQERHLEPTQIHPDSYLNESILYQSGLLNKFFVDVLLLNISRAAIDQKYRNLIGGIAAGIAMFFYLLLFIWQGAVFVINSEPFILFTIIIYILKDRLKDELKTLSFNQAFRLFSDYKTEIISPSGKYVVGELKESFSFIDEERVPEEIARMRNREFHTYLETIKRPERVICYKKTITIFQKPSTVRPPRLRALNIIFRYDIHRFLSKASDPYEPHISLNPDTLELNQSELPKIYHINIILKNQETAPDGSQKTELKKFRLVIDKDGIKRVENIVPLQAITTQPT